MYILGLSNLMCLWLDAAIYKVFVRNRLNTCFMMGLNILCLHCNPLLSERFLFSGVFCNEGDVRLYNQESYYDTEDLVLVTSGVLEVCVNGNYLQLCNSASTDPALGYSICYALGYDGQLLTQC